MTSLKAMYDAAVNGQNLVVTTPHYQWMEMLESEQVPSKAALIHVIRVLLRQYKHQRTGRFSPSSMGECKRRLVLGYAGAPQLAPDTNGQEMMDHGTVAHLKWQIEGITMGYMKAAEVWVEDKDLMIGGSMDAELEDDSLFELKSAAPSVFNRIVLEQAQPKWENLLQVHTYFIMSDKVWASVVYEDRAHGNFHEFRVGRDDKIEKEVLRQLGTLKRWVEDDLLPPQLDPCSMKMGQVYRRCPYREVCPIPQTVSAAQALSTGEDDGAVVPLGKEIPAWAQKFLDLATALEGEVA